MSDASDEELPRAAFEPGNYSDSSDDDDDYSDDGGKSKGSKSKKANSAGESGKGAAQGADAASGRKKQTAIPLTEELETPWFAPKIDPALMEEVLLVTQNLGVFVDLEDGSKLFVKGENSTMWLTDLQKALSREDNDSRLVSTQLHKLNVPHDKLFPFLLESLDDPRAIVIMFKILLKLTKPLSEASEKDLSLPQDPKAGALTKQRNADRKGHATQQLRQLQAMKQLFLDKNVMALLVWTMNECMGDGKRSRSEEQSLTLELCLHIVRNVLAIPDNLEALHSNSNAGLPMHDRFVSTLGDETFGSSMLDIVSILIEDIGTRDNKPLNLVLLEVTHHLLKDQCPEKIALAIHALSANPTATATAASEAKTSNDKDASGDAPNRTATAAAARPSASATAAASVEASKKKLREVNRLAASGGISLKQKLLAQKYSGASGVVPQSRHSHFGGVLRLQGSNGANLASGRAATLASNPLQATAQGMHAPLQGSAVVAKADRRKKTFNAARGYHSGRTTGQESEKYIAKFCASCLHDSYQVFFSSLKAEFRLESSRLHEADRVVFFRLQRFFLALRRHSRIYDDVTSNSGEVYERVERALVFTSMDMFSFNLVHRYVESYAAEKKWLDLEHCTELLLEMVHLLWYMRAASPTTTSASSGEEEEGQGRGANLMMRRIAVGLMSSIYLGSDPTDKLGLLWRTWQPATFSKQHLLNLCELGYMTFKVLDLRLKRDDFAVLDKEVEAKMEIAKLFDLHNYTKKLATADIVGLHRKLLEHYPHNSPRNNHHCVSFFKRLCATPLEHEDDDDDEEEAHMYFAAASSKEKGLRTSKPTLEPMLYNVPMLALCAKILNDPLVNGRDTRTNFEGVQSFAASLIRHFTRMASSNRVLFADAIFTQAALARVKYCQRLNHHYADPLTVAALSLPLHREEAPDEVTKETGDSSSSSYREQAVSSTRAATRSATKPLNEGDDEEDDGEENREGMEGDSAAAAGAGVSEEGAGGGGLVDSDEEEFDVDAEVEAVPKKVLMKKKRMVKKKPSSQGGDKKTTNWSRGEDAVLKELYAKYADSASVELMLVEGLKEAGYEDHNEAEIMQRAKQLRLKAWDANDDDDEGGSSDDDDEDVPSSQAAFARLMADDDEEEEEAGKEDENGDIPAEETFEEQLADKAATNDDDDDDEDLASSNKGMAEDDTPATERQDHGMLDEEDEEEEEEAAVATSNVAVENAAIRKREASALAAEEAVADEEEEAAPKSRLRKKAKKANSVPSAKGLSDSDDE